MKRRFGLYALRLTLLLSAVLVLAEIIRVSPGPPVFLAEVEAGQQVLLQNTVESTDGLNWVEIKNTGDGFAWMIITEKAHRDSMRGDVIPYGNYHQKSWAYEPHLALEVVDRTVKVYMPPSWVVAETEQVGP